MSTAALIQARMTSTRLPGKVMAEVAGFPLIHHVVSRVQSAHLVHTTILATTDRPTDDVLAQYCQETDVPCFRGSEADVLDRFYQAACSSGADTVVRLTADCPLLDPQVMDKVIGVFREGDYDYASNTLVRTYPDGLDTEVFSFCALEKAWREARLESEREHVTPYIWKHPELFRLGSVVDDHDHSQLRWTVDEPRDLAFVREVYAHLGTTSVFGMSDVLALLHRHPELLLLNEGIVANEGYERSMGEDHIDSGARKGQ